MIIKRNWRDTHPTIAHQSGVDWRLLSSTTKTSGDIEAELEPRYRCLKTITYVSFAKLQPRLSYEPTKWIRGLDADTLKDILVEQSNDELGHAEKIAKRIIQLGGTPIMDPGKLLQISGCGYKQSPNDPNNLKQVIQDVLESEACAIETYNKFRKIQDN